MTRMTTPTRSSDASARLASLAVPHVSVVVASKRLLDVVPTTPASLGMANALNALVEAAQ